MTDQIWTPEIEKRAIAAGVLDTFANKHFCGCGRPDGAWQFLLDVLRMKRRHQKAYRDNESTETPDERKARCDAQYKEWSALVPCDHEVWGGMAWSYLYWLNESTDLAEHGGNVSAFWLTGIGEAFLDDMEIFGSGEEIESALS